ncbi:MAG TPA: alpha/beta hydrolase [Bryobacteraceae bacterium]|nr:alpha/beta hydrolase [Bryobacteraceae bacterium]
MSESSWRPFFRLLALLLAAVPVRAEEPQDARITNAGLEIHYRVFGTGAPILILSGGPGFDCDYLIPLAGDLGKTHRAILVDLRGTGRSVPVAISHDTVNLKLTLSDLEAVREQLGLRRWTVLGHSAGAVLAMAYATNYPASIQSMLLVNSGPIRRASGAAEMDNLAMHLTPQEREEMARSGAKDFGSLFKFLVPGYFYDRAHIAELPPVFSPANFHEATANLMAADLFAGSGDLRSGLKDFSQPVLVIAGRQDPCDPAMQYEIHLALKNSTLRLLDKCGHFSWIEQRDEFYSVVSEFLKAHANR